MTEVRLGQIANIFTGKCNAQDAVDDGIYPLFDRSGEVKKSDKYFADCEAIIVPGESTTFIPRYYKGKFNLHQRAYCINPHEDVNGVFLYYLIKANSPYFFSVATGATVASLRLNNFVKMKLNLPLRQAQDKIANILSTYDKLIENNDKRIAILEQEAEELYKEWFVRFRFPGYEKITFKETSTGLRIPETFEIKPINSVLSYYIGGGWGNDDFTNEYSVPASVIRGADFPNIINGCYTKLPYRYHKESNHKFRILKEGDIVFEISGGTAEQPVGRSIYVTKGLIETNRGAICASFCKFLRCNDSINPQYFYFWLKFLYETRIIDRYQLQSTGIINFNFKFFLRKGFVMIPPKDVMTKFSKQIVSIFNLIDTLGKENYLLSTQRDYLLPRLMSGKLEVK